MQKKTLLFWFYETEKPRLLFHSRESLYRNFKYKLASQRCTYSFFLLEQYKHCTKLLAKFFSQITICLLPKKKSIFAHSMDLIDDLK